MSADTIQLNKEYYKKRYITYSTRRKIHSLMESGGRRSVDGRKVGEEEKMEEEDQMEDDKVG